MANPPPFSKLFIIFVNDLILFKYLLLLMPQSCIALPDALSFPLSLPDFYMGKI